MHFALYQIIIAMIALFMIYQGVKNYLRGGTGNTPLKLAVRITVWGSMATIVLFPNLSNSVATLIGIGSNMNAVILIGFLLVFLMIFKLLSAIERLEQQLTSVTREKALQDNEIIPPR